MNIETLDGTSWDVLIAGTGLHESLLALALSRSGKNILHVDKNGYYGGANAALSLQDAESWAGKHSGEEATSSFANAVVETPSPSQVDGGDEASLKLSFSRAYSLALSPQVIYAQSILLPTLVTSRVDQQLEFLAVGSCFVFVRDGQPESAQVGAETSKGTLVRVPSSREDVFADEGLEPRHKRGLMKFLRFISDFEDQHDMWEPHQSQPFDEFLSNQFYLPPLVQRPLQALTLSSSLPQKTKTSFALPRIARHLRSIGVFGPGFGSVIPKWGGLSEIAQVGCRACAVGGAVYVLGNGLSALKASETSPNDASGKNETKTLQADLSRGETVTADWVVTSIDNAPMPHLASSQAGERETTFPDAVYRSIFIVSSQLKELFPQLVEGAPTPAAAVIVLPSSSLSAGQSDDEGAPVHIMVHSSDTGECPVGQSVLYASVVANAGLQHSVLDKAVSALLETVEESPAPQVLWKLQYEQRTQEKSINSDASDSVVNDHAIVFPPPPQDLAFDDIVLRQRIYSKPPLSSNATDQSVPFPVFHIINRAKKTVTIGKLLAFTSPIEPCPKYTGPVDVVLGSGDFIFCQGDCGIPSNQAAMVQPALYRNSRGECMNCSLEGAGHAVNTHENAGLALNHIFGFLEKNAL